MRTEGPKGVSALRELAAARASFPSTHPSPGSSAQGNGAFGSPRTSGGEPDGALAPMAAWAGRPQGRVQDGPSTLPKLQLGFRGASEQRPPGQRGPGPRAPSHSALRGRRRATALAPTAAPAATVPPRPCPAHAAALALPPPRSGSRGPGPGAGGRAAPAGPRWGAPAPTPPHPTPPRQVGLRFPLPRAPPGWSRGGGLPGQVRGVSAQGQQEPTAAQRPRGPVGPAATPCRGPPAARPDSRARPRPARRSRRLPARAAPGGGAAPPAARPHSCARPPRPRRPPESCGARGPAKPARRDGAPGGRQGLVPPGAHLFTEGSRSLRLTPDPRPGSRGDSEVPAQSLGNGPADRRAGLLVYPGSWGGR